MKKIVSLLLVMAITMLVVPVNAETEPVFVVEQAAAAPGETVDVTISVKNNPGVASIRLKVTYDQGLTLNSVTYNDAIGGMSMQPQQMTSPVTLNWFNGTANSTGDWVFATLSFTVSIDAQKGEHPIEITYEPNNVYNIAEENLPFAIENGAVNVGEAAPSDIDDFTYEISGSEIIINGYTGTKGEVAIAESYVIDGVEYTVTAIDMESFYENDTVTRVVIPKTVEEIGEAAFYDCPNLKEVVVWNKDLVIGEVALGCEPISRRQDGLVEGFVLYGLPGSTAETYAQTIGEDIGVEETMTFIQMPNLSGASLTLYNNISVSFKADGWMFATNGLTNPYVEFVFNGTKKTVSTYTTDAGRLVFTFNGIAPNQMNDTISVTLYGTYDGVEYASQTKEYSVAAYCYNMLKKCSGDEYAEFRTLLVDLLQYGAAAQTYTGYNTSAMVNANLTAEQLTWGTTTDRQWVSVLNPAYETVVNPTVTLEGAGLNLETAVTVRLKFTTASTEGITLKIVTQSGFAYTIPASQFELSEGVYHAYFTGLNAGQMSETIYMTFYKDGVAISNTATYSIESYAVQKQADADTDLVALLKAMMRYGDAAYAYVN